MQFLTRRRIIKATVVAGAGVLVGVPFLPSSFPLRRSPVSNGGQNKKRLREFVQVVWEGRDLSALPRFWTADCVNHASPTPENVGLAALLTYHEGFITGFLPHFSNARIEFLQQVAESDRMVSQMVFLAKHTGPAFGLPATGKDVSLASIRIDRFEGDNIAEHWSVADMAGFMLQLQSS